MAFWALTRKGVLKKRFYVPTLSGDEESRQYKVAAVSEGDEEIYVLCFHAS